MCIADVYVAKSFIVFKIFLLGNAEAFCAYCFHLDKGIDVFPTCIALFYGKTGSEMSR